MAAVKAHRPQGSRDRGKGASFDSVAEIAGRDFETVLVMTEWREGEKIIASSHPHFTNGGEPLTWMPSGNV